MSPPAAAATVAKGRSLSVRFPLLTAGTSRKGLTCVVYEVKSEERCDLSASRCVYLPMEVSRGENSHDINA